MVKVTLSLLALAAAANAWPNFLQYDNVQKRQFGTGTAPIPTGFPTGFPGTGIFGDALVAATGTGGHHHPHGTGLPGTGVDKRQFGTGSFTLPTGLPTGVPTGFPGTGVEKRQFGTGSFTFPTGLPTGMPTGFPGTGVEKRQFGTGSAPIPTGLPTGLPGTGFPSFPGTGIFADALVAATGTGGGHHPPHGTGLPGTGAPSGFATKVKA